MMNYSGFPGRGEVTFPHVIQADFCLRSSPASHPPGVPQATPRASAPQAQPQGGAPGWSVMAEESKQSIPLVFLRHNRKHLRAKNAFPPEVHSVVFLTFRHGLLCSDTISQVPRGAREGPSKHTHPTPHESPQKPFKTCHCPFKSPQPPASKSIFTSFYRQLIHGAKFSYQMLIFPPGTSEVSAGRPPRQHGARVHGGITAEQLASLEARALSSQRFFLGGWGVEGASSGRSLPHSNSFPPPQSRQGPPG